jgi:xanthine dehydrogenase accessory factor
VFIEPVIPEPALIILGAGHVGRALTKIAAFSGFRVTVIDDREEYANRDNLPDAHEILVRDFGDSISGAVAGSCAYIVIATRGHNHDLEALKTALRTDARYIGLVGSRRKRALLFKTLSDEGFSENDIGRVIIPVGLPIHSTTPEEIAISIVAQMIQQRRTCAHEGYSLVLHGRFIEEDGAVKTAPPVNNKPAIRHCVDTIIASGIDDIIAS